MLLSEFTFGLGILDAITTSHGFKVVAENFVYFLGGAWYTIFITLSVAMGMVLGIAGLGKLSKIKFYTQYPRPILISLGHPLFVQIFLLYFGFVFDNDHFHHYNSIGTEQWCLHC